MGPGKAAVEYTNQEAQEELFRKVVPVIVDLVLFSIILPPVIILFSLKITGH